MCLESKDSIVAKCPEIYFVKKVNMQLFENFQNLIALQV